MSLRLFTKSYRNDFPWLRLAMKSVDYFCQDRVEWTIAVERQDHAELLQLLKCFTWNKCTFKPYIAEETWPEIAGMRGYDSQQWVKMNAHVVMDGIFWCIDSDVIVQRPFSKNNLLGLSKKPILWFSQFNALMGGADDAAHRRRQEVIKRIFHIPDASFEFMRGLPIPLNAEILRCGSKRQEWGDSLNMLKNGEPGFSEFNVIGEFTHQFFPDAVEFCNAETSGPTFSGGYVQGGSGSGTLDGVSIFSQFWSYGGVPDNVKNWVEGLK